MYRQRQYSIHGAFYGATGDTPEVYPEAIYNQLLFEYFNQEQYATFYSPTSLASMASP